MINRQMETNSFSMGEFVWWLGVVEDRMDPKGLGRCRCRIIGYHTKDKTDMPTEELPWAFPLQPITSGAMNGIGTSPTGVVEGTWVFGFFRDGHNAQDPVMIGTFGGIPQETSDGKGFSDPNKKYPKEDFIKEPDTNRLARSEKLDETIIQTKKDERELDIQRGLNDGTWSEKETPYAAKYPYCHTRETESGIIEEFDDTEGSERYGLYHPSNTWLEIHPDGDKVEKISKDKYEIIAGNEYILIKGDVSIRIEGNANIIVQGDTRLETEGNRDEYVHGDYQLLVGGSMNVQAEGQMFLDASRIDLNKPGPGVSF